MATHQPSNVSPSAPGTSPPTGRHNIVVAPVYVAKGFARSRIMRSRNQVREEIQSWASGSMKGHVHLIRNSGIVVSNILAERALEDHLWALSTERQRHMRRRDYERVLFLERLKLKSSAFREMVERIEARQSAQHTAYVPPGTGDPASVPDANRSSTKKLLVHALPMLKSKYDDASKSEMVAETNLGTVFSTEAKPTKMSTRTKAKSAGAGYNRVHFQPQRPLIKFENADHLRNGNVRNTRSARRVGTVVPPSTEDLYETFIPVRHEDSGTLSYVEFIPSNAVLATSIPVPPNFFNSSSSRAPNIRRVMSAPSARHPADRTAADKTVDDTWHSDGRKTEMTALIETIDSLHVPPIRQKKFKVKTNVLREEIFGSS